MRMQGVVVDLVRVRVLVVLYQDEDCGLYSDVFGRERIDLSP
jgi:hypothetical protein